MLTALTKKTNQESPKPSNINTPTKSQTLGDCCDLLTQENVSDALERKSNNVEQPVSLSSLLLSLLIVYLGKEVM